MSEGKKDETTTSTHLWRCTTEEVKPGKGDAQVPDPDDDRAKLREQRRRGRQTFYLPPEVSFVETVERATRNGPQASAMEIRDLGTQGIAFRNAIAWLTERLRYAMGERDLLEEHLRLERQDHLRHKDLHLSAEKRLTDTMGMYHDLKKQIAKPGKRKAASR
jgi:hypothetical protein